MTTLVPIGGFLGAGKTTLILMAARVLRSRGVRAAAIFNDQGADLVDTMKAHQRCVGVSAPQLGELVRMVVVDVTEHPRATRHHGLLVLVNPEIVLASGAEVAREGCLSIPDLTANVASVLLSDGIPSGGSVSFTVDGSFQSMVPLSGAAATLPLSNLAAGSHTIGATYSGDAANTGSSGTLSQIVKP